VRARVCVCRLSRITCVYIWYAACLVCVRMCACVSSRDIIASAMTHHIPMRCPDRGRMTARALVLCMCPLHLCACACASVLLKSGITQTRHVGLDMYPRKETPSCCSQIQTKLIDAGRTQKSVVGPSKMVSTMTLPIAGLCWCKRHPRGFFECAGGRVTRGRCFLYQYSGLYLV